jgi:flavin-binding protein dodecin
MVTTHTGGSVMTDHVYRVTEIVGTSPNGVDDAIQNATRRAAKTLHNLDWFEVTDIRGHFTGETIGHFQVTMKVGFRLDDDD